MNPSRTTWARPLALAVTAAASLWLGAASAQSLALDTLSDEQLGRLRKVALDKGTSIPVPPALTAALRFSPEQVAPAVRQVSFQGDDGVKHGFARLNDESGYFLFRRAPAGIWAFHVGKDLKLVVAAHNFSAQAFIALPEAAGREELAAELNAWSRVLSPHGISLVPPGSATPAPPRQAASPAAPGTAAAPGAAPRPAP